MIDTIDRVSWVHRWQPTPYLLAHSLICWLDWIEQMLRENPPNSVRAATYGNRAVAHTLVAGSNWQGKQATEADTMIISDLKSYMESPSFTSLLSNTPNHRPETRQDDRQKIYTVVSSNCVNRTIFFTESGRLGLRSSSCAAR